MLESISTVRCLLIEFMFAQEVAIPIGQRAPLESRATYENDAIRTSQPLSVNNDDDKSFYSVRSYAPVMKARNDTYIHGFQGYDPHIGWTAHSISDRGARALALIGKCTEQTTLLVLRQQASRTPLHLAQNHAHHNSSCC